MTPCASRHHRMTPCSRLPKARTTRPPLSQNGIGLPWKNRSLTCIPPPIIGNLECMAAMTHTIAERDAWGGVAQDWRQLYGDFDHDGISVQWHDFRSDRLVDWGQSFHPRSLEFCLNLEGRGEVGGHGAGRSAYLPGSSGYYAIADDPLSASRRAHDHHEFVTLEF